MSKRTVNFIILLSIFLLLILAGPFFVPIKPLENTFPPKELADPDSLFIEVNELIVHAKIQGMGDPTLILLHGFGASTFSWREVIGPLSEHGTVLAYDRPAFGLTERPLVWEGSRNPYSPESQVNLLIGLMDALHIEKAYWVGNSAGGTVALNAALNHPDRVEGLILVDAAVYQGGGAPAFVRPLLQTPQLDHLGPLIARQISSRGDDFVRSAWADPNRVTHEILAGYRKPLQAENWDIALWELTKASRQSTLPDHIFAVQSPALVISGAEDTIVPLAFSMRLAEELPNAYLAVFQDCGHLPQEECPAEFVEAILEFIQNHP